MNIQIGLYPHGPRIPTDAEEKAFKAKHGQPMSRCAGTSGTYLNVLSIPDGNGYTHPNYRYFEKKNGVLYFDDGTVANVEDGRERFGFATEHGEKYSTWDDAKRAQVKKERKLAQEKFEKEQAERQAAWEVEMKAHEALVERARKKLTAEEFDAVKREGSDESRDY